MAALGMAEVPAVHQARALPEGPARALRSLGRIRRQSHRAHQTGGGPAVPGRHRPRPHRTGHVCAAHEPPAHPRPGPRARSLSRVGGPLAGVRGRALSLWRGATQSRPWAFSLSWGGCTDFRSETSERGQRVCLITSKNGKASLHPVWTGRTVFRTSPAPTTFRSCIFSVGAVGPAAFPQLPHRHE